MSRNYTYDPGNLEDNTRDRARFELGDTLVEGGQTTAALCDEEYDAIIKTAKNWKTARYELLKAITMRLSFEVDTTVSGLSYSLNQRAERWREMLKDAKKALLTGVPTADSRALEPLYFHREMMKNPDRDFTAEQEGGGP